MTLAISLRRLDGGGVVPLWRIPPFVPPAIRMPSRRAVFGRAALRRLSDAELLALVKDGDAEAFELIYERHVGVAFGLAARICGSRGVAEDVVQEAFLSVWRGRDRYEPSRGEVRSWVLGIVHHRAIDRIRRSGVHERRRADAEGIEEVLEAPDRTEVEIQQREQADEVRTALQTLPDEQRRVIELAYFDGLTHTEIASRLGAPLGTIKGRMRLGLLKLHAELTGESVASAGGVIR